MRAPLWESFFLFLVDIYIKASVFLGDFNNKFYVDVK